MGDPQVDIRRFAAGDSLKQLTALLNDAYRIHLQRGLRYVATWQDETLTSTRMAGAECWIAMDGDRIVGTITLRPPARAGGHPFLDRPDVAVFNQLAVAPAYQGSGLGHRLMACAETRARELGAAEIACETAQSEVGLIDWYKRQGYRVVGTANRETTNYVSYVLSKRLAPEKATPASRRPRRAPPSR